VILGSVVFLEVGGPHWGSMGGSPVDRTPLERGRLEEGWPLTVVGWLVV